MLKRSDLQGPTSLGTERGGAEGSAGLPQGRKLGDADRNSLGIIRRALCDPENKCWVRLVCWAVLRILCTSTG